MTTHSAPTQAPAQDQDGPVEQGADAQQVPAAEDSEPTPDREDHDTDEEREAAAEQRRQLAQAAAEDAAADLLRSDTTMSRVSTTSAALLTILAAGVGFTSGDANFPFLAKVAMGGAVLILALIMAGIAAATWPQRGGSGGVHHYAAYADDPDGLADALAADEAARWHAERAAAKAAITVRRYPYQRAADIGQALAGVLLAFAVIAALV